MQEIDNLQQLGYSILEDIYIEEETNQILQFISDKELDIQQEYLVIFYSYHKIPYSFYSVQIRLSTSILNREFRVMKAKINSLVFYLNIF